MNNQWNLLFEGNVEGRSIKLLVYLSGELRVETTQKETEVMEGSNEEGQILVPAVFSKGDTIHIDADTAEELEKELIECGFSEKGAKEITGYAIQPST